MSHTESPPEETIKLDQFLKLAQIVDSGGQAKHLIQAGFVQVNGQVETRRGRKLRHGDVVLIDDDVEIQVVIEPEE
jgi:ribosome-associated protein